MEEINQDTPQLWATLVSLRWSAFSHDVHEASGSAKAALAWARGMEKSKLLPKWWKDPSQLDAFWHRIKWMERRGEALRTAALDGRRNLVSVHTLGHQTNHRADLPPEELRQQVRNTQPYPSQATAADDATRLMYPGSPYPSDDAAAALDRARCWCAGKGLSKVSHHLRAAQDDAQSACIVITNLGRRLSLWREANKAECVARKYNMDDYAINPRAIELRASDRAAMLRLWSLRESWLLLHNLSRDALACRAALVDRVEGLQAIGELEDRAAQAVATLRQDQEAKG